MLSLSDNVLYRLDRYVAKIRHETSEKLTRNYLIVRLAEVLSEALEQNNYDVEKIELKVIGKERTTSVVLYIRKVMEHEQY